MVDGVKESSGKVLTRKERWDASEGRAEWGHRKMGVEVAPGLSGLHKDPMHLLEREARFKRVLVWF